MTLQEEIQMQLDRAGNAVPWVLRQSVSGVIAQPGEISHDEILHGHALLLREYAAVILRLAGEIDKLKTGH